MLCALSSIAHANPATLTATQHYDALLQSTSAKNTSTPQALAKLYAARRLRLQVPTAHAAATLLRAQRATKDPLVRAALVRTRARVLQDVGDTAQGPRGTKGDLKTLGCLTTFSMVGPFPNASMENFNVGLPPEAGEAGPYEGRVGQIDWRPLPDVSSMCRLNVNKTLPTSGDTVVYLAATLTSKRAQKLKLMLGANGVYRIWLNGKPVALRDTNTGLALDNDAWDMSLKRGANTLLIKLASDQISGLDMIARLVDSTLSPASDVVVAPGWRGTPVEGFDAKSLPKASDKGVLAQVQQWTKKSTGNDAVWGAWLWQLIERANVAVPWRDVATRVEGQMEQGQVTLSAQSYELMPQLYEEHWKRVNIMERARKAYPNDPWIATAMARLYESSLSDTRRMGIRGLLEQTIKAHPTHLRAVEMLSDWYERRGFHVKALEVLKAHASPLALQSPQFAMELVNTQKTYGDRAQANTLRHKVYAQTLLRSGYAWTVLNEHVLNKKTDSAIALVKRMRQVYPWSSVWLEQHVELLRSQNKSAEALALFDEALTARPGDTDLMQGKARLLVAQGKREEAATLLTQALTYRPQDTEIRERIAHLRPGENRFHEDWMLDDVRVLAKKTIAGPFDSTTILDQTIVRVGTNGLSQKVTQVVERVNTTRGVSAAKYHRIAFQGGDERVEVLKVKIHKKDGSVSDDYDTWTSGNSRKANTTYNDSGTVNVRANNVEVGDMVEVRYRVSEVANQNFRGDYFGDISYMQGTNPIGMTRYTILYPKSWNLYFRKPSLPHTRTDNVLPSGKPVLELKATSFTLNQVPDVKTDANQPGHTSVYDYILVSNKKTYNEIGAWWWNLVKEQLIVDENIRAKVKELVKGLKTEDQKIAAIHNYVVQNTRYLHVGLGIHGWKPYRTSTCFRNRYGDCKDKAALLKVMLVEAGVPANLVLVRTRRLGKVEAQPASMHIFNHAITYVPSKDLYLDGTAEFNGTSELTSMDQGAQALIVEDGGKARFVTLPVDKPTANVMSHKLEVDLTGKEPIGKGTIVATGSNAVYYRTSLEDATRRKDLFEKQLANQFPGAKLVDATFSDLKALEKPVTITYSFTGGELLRSSAAREFVYPLGKPRNMIRGYAAQSSRTQALTIRVPFSSNTTITYKLDPTKAWGAPIAPVKLKSKFGHLNLKVVRNQETLTVDVEYSLANQQVSAQDYPEFRAFITKMNSALNATTEVQQEKKP